MTRRARFENRISQYNPSTTEVLLEKICNSFGTELLPAQINPVNGTKLVRISKPAIIKKGGRVRVLQFQYTRFSPLSSQRMVEVYNKNRAVGRRKEISHDAILKEIEEQHSPWDSIREVTDESYIENLRLHRWPKSLYFAVYDINKGIEKRIKPFLVHEINTELEGVKPTLCLSLNIEPFFVVRMQREGTKDICDSLDITFPKMREDNDKSFLTALGLHPLQGEKFTETHKPTFYGSYKIKANHPRELTMGFIRAYLRKFCLNEDFY